MRYNKVLVCITTILLGLCACGTKEAPDEEVTSMEEARKDSMALHVAVYPCEGALPLYYAEAAGMLDSAGDIRLLHLKTMEDCDTAIQFKHAEVVMSDIARLLCMRKDGFRATAIAGLPGSLGIFTPKSTRINEVKQLKERIVAIDRHSETDYYSDKVLEGTKLDRLDIFRTQFNNHKLREEMLTNKLVDGAFLDEPYATLALAHGAKRIWQRDEKAATWGVLATPTTLLTDKRRMEQMQSLAEAYRLAVEAMNNGSNAALTGEILKKHYELPNIEVDTLTSLQSSITISNLRPIQDETVETAKKWLVGRQWINASLSTDSITHNIIKQ